MELIKRFGPNLRGRDFVCGDLHGCFHLLQAFKEFVSFDDDSDRMFFVGDLTDRGPYSRQCTYLVFQKWAHSVKGNHEQMLIDWAFNGPYGDYFFHNGGFWATELELDEIKQIANKIDKLPLLITVEKKDGSLFHIIHAEFCSILPLTDAHLADEKIFNSRSRDGMSVLWGRSLFSNLCMRELNEGAKVNAVDVAQRFKYLDAFTPMLSPIYSGHTILQQPVRFKGQTNIDTGAYYSTELYKQQGHDWAGLTITEPETDKFWTVNNYGVREVRPVELIS